MTVEIIRPEFDLAVKLGPGKGIDPAILERAEQAVAALADSYIEWAAKDVERLQAAANEARSVGDDAPLDDLRGVAHEVRGQGGSFGYPLVSRIATSLYRLLRERPTLPPGGLGAVDKHIDALRAVVARRVKGDGGALGQQLAGELESLVDRLLAEAS